MNLVADALSRKAALASCCVVSSSMLDHIKEGLKEDPLARNLMESAIAGKTRKFWVEDGILYTTG